MLFSSNMFLFLFLPVVLLVYYVALHGRGSRNTFLTLASLFFYAWGEPYFVLIMLLSIVCNYLFGLWVYNWKNTRGQAKLPLCLMVIFNLAIFVLFKYVDFIIANVNVLFRMSLPMAGIALPIGISFFTFQAMSYVFDVYYDRGELQRNPLNVALYISFFPQLIAGPIVRYQTVTDQIKNRKESFNDFTYGTMRFTVGLGKKVILANSFASLADLVFAPDRAFALSMPLAWLGAIAYTLQIYFDFGGYSDMAIGLGRMFGFHFDENFNYPYISSSITDFWRRWHISLGTWFRDYVYFPLGGSRVKSKSRLAWNLFVVWFLTGLWHGASWNFIVWGLFYYVLLCYEKLVLPKLPILRKTPLFLKHVLTLLCVVIGWVFFRAANLTLAFEYLKAMFSFGQVFSPGGVAIYLLKDYALLLLLGFVASTPLLPKLRQKIECSSAKVISAQQILGAAGCVLILLVSVTYIVKGTYNPFIYFNF